MGRDLVEAATQVWHVLQSNLGPMLAALWSLLQKLWELFKPLIIVIGVQLWLAFKLITEILPPVIFLITKLIEWLAKIIEGALDVVTFFRDKFVEPIINALIKVADWVKDKFVAAWNFILGPIKRVIDTIIGWVQNIIDKLETLFGWIKDVASSVAGSPTNVGDVGPRGPVGKSGLQHGGEVLSTGMALVHKGEVFSGVHGEVGMGGLTVIINGDVTGEEVVRKVRDGLLKLKARNSTTGL
jgi:hypothetical protein